MPQTPWNYCVEFCHRQNSQAVRLRWTADYPPASIDELIHSDFDTTSPFTLKFDEADRGKRVYFCLRWESNTNLKGPWGEIYSAIIP